MHYDYVVAGNVMLDTVRFLDGSQSDRENIGGPATFAYSGIRIWTDSVMQCSNLGADYEELFTPWIKKNQVETAGYKIICDRCNHTYLVYQDVQGGYGEADRESLNEDQDYKWLKNDAWQDFGYMKTTPEEIEAFTNDGQVKGVYVAQNADRTFWRKLSAIKKRDGFKLMWEIEAPWALKHYLPDIIEICEDVDVFSINIAEAQRLFEVEGDEACIRGLQALPVDMTLFRVGERGLYVVTPTDAIYLPPAKFSDVVDPTGCGNSSTGSALYAYAEGNDPLMVGIMANIASAQNIRQYGIIPDFAAIREESYQLAGKLYEQYKNK